MANMSKIKHLSLQPNMPQHQVLEEDETISSQQTLDDSIPNCSNLIEDDDDLVNVDEEEVPYTFNFGCPDSTVFHDCLYGHEEEYDQMDFITDLVDSRGEIEHVSDFGIIVSEANNDHDDNDDFVSSNIEEPGFGFQGGGGLRVFGIESNSSTEESGQVNDQNDERIQITESGTD
ncbi:hypothetical protein L6452_01010 [Arctium lappa]|uniref:Uncharacterized protein n=1 Tax=Arctium lappa TaxID=4217 RepID=A0ACB9FFX4_ARCLA|nr:hypothetical protein L6452_01010 [Arctium lappa]